MARKLRIAFSATCVILCLLLIAFWVRSQSSVDWMGSVVTDRYVAVISTWPGSCAIRIANDIFVLKPWAWRSQPVRDEDRELLGSFHWPDDFVSFLMVPYWLLVFVAATLAAAPWIEWPRAFSLRTLLIATTLMAVLLGALVYAVK